MANLKAAVQWIALNDNAGEKDTVEDTAGYLTVFGPRGRHLRQGRD